MLSAMNTKEMMQPDKSCLRDKGKLTDSIDVVKDGLSWKISSGTKGFN